LGLGLGLIDLECLPLYPEGPYVVGLGSDRSLLVDDITLRVLRLERVCTPILLPYVNNITAATALDIEEGTRHVTDMHTKHTVTLTTLFLTSSEFRRNLLESGTGSATCVILACPSIIETEVTRVELGGVLLVRFKPPKIDPTHFIYEEGNGL